MMDPYLEDESLAKSGSAADWLSEMSNVVKKFPRIHSFMNRTQRRKRNVKRSTDLVAFNER